MSLHFYVDIYTRCSTAKHLKLYHRTFLINLIVHIRLGTFLEHFTNFLIEAVGGYSWDWRSRPKETLSKTTVKQPILNRSR